MNNDILLHINYSYVAFLCFFVSSLPDLIILNFTLIAILKIVTVFFSGQCFCFVLLCLCSF